MSLLNYRAETTHHTTPYTHLTSLPHLLPFCVYFIESLHMSPSCEERLNVNHTVSAPYYKIQGLALPQVSYFESIVWFGDGFRLHKDMQKDLIYTLAPLAWVCRGGRGCHIMVRYVTFNVNVSYSTI